MPSHVSKKHVPNTQIYMYASIITLYHKRETSQQKCTYHMQTCAHHTQTCSNHAREHAIIHHTETRPHHTRTCLCHKCVPIKENKKQLHSSRTNKHPSQKHICTHHIQTELAHTIQSYNTARASWDPPYQEQDMNEWITNGSKFRPTWQFTPHLHHFSCLVTHYCVTADTMHLLDKTIGYRIIHANLEQFWNKIWLHCSQIKMKDALSDMQATEIKCRNH